MTPFRRQSPEPPTEEERQAAAVDLDRIGRGGIPLGAEQRLSGSMRPVRLHQRSEREGVRARSGVGSQPARAGDGLLGRPTRLAELWLVALDGGIVEMPRLAVPRNLSRQRSFDRLSAGGPVRRGRRGDRDRDDDATAFRERQRRVRRLSGPRCARRRCAAGDRSGPRMCALSGQDVDKLRRIGARDDWCHRPHRGRVRRAQHAGQPDDGRLVGQPGDDRATQGVYAARHLAMEEVRRQAGELGANDMVISTLTHDIHHHEYESPGFRQHFFIVSMHVLGTAIRLGAHEPHPAPLGVPVMSINLGR